MAHVGPYKPCFSEYKSMLQQKGHQQHKAKQFNTLNLSAHCDLRMGILIGLGHQCRDSFLPSRQCCCCCILTGTGRNRTPLSHKDQLNRSLVTFRIKTQGLGGVLKYFFDKIKIQTDISVTEST